jgi:pimeloyl-ACP methyl ester carboxylesterase
MPGEFADVVVLLPGITGSVLERNGRVVWGASAGAVLRGLFSGGQSIQDLLLVNDDPDADDLGDGVQATALVSDVHLFPGLWTIDGYTKVAKRLCQRLGLEPGVNYFELPYDWRRDNRVAARRLQRESAAWLAQRRKTHPDAKLVVVAHSMGGLIARYFIEVLGGWKDTRALITFGTPYRGSVNAFETLVNGERKLKVVDLTDLSRSFTSIYQLLPIYPCFDRGHGALVRLAECNDIPRLDQKQHDRIRSADAFHREIEKAVERNQASVGAGVVRYVIRPVVGIDQPTSQTAVASGDRIDVVRARNGTDESGDGTVPRVSATPIEAGEGQAAFAAARHGSLQNTDAVLAHVQGILTAPRDLGQVRAVGAPVTLSLDVDNIFAARETVQFAVRASVVGVPLEAVCESTDGSAPRQVVRLPPSNDEWRRGELPSLPAGVYRLIVSGDPTRVEPVADVFGVA